MASVHIDHKGDHVVQCESSQSDERSYHPVSLRTAVKNRFLVDGVPRPIFWGPARGMRLTDCSSMRVYLGLYEVELNRWIRQLVPPHSGCFDVGGEHGYDALMLARLNIDAPVTSFEADPDSCQRIRQNTTRNGLGSRISVYEGFVGTGNGSTVSLDTVAEQTFWPGFVKMDIEGAEVEALAGSSRMLERCSNWLIEVHSRELERACLQVFTSAGYDIDLVNPRRWLPDRRPIAHNRWIVATRELTIDQQRLRQIEASA
jgi:hypothetical protein